MILPALGDSNIIFICKICWDLKYLIKFSVALRIYDKNCSIYSKQLQFLYYWSFAITFLCGTLIFTGVFEAQVVEPAAEILNFYQAQGEKILMEYKPHDSKRKPK